MTGSWTGGCQCGAVRYRVDGPLGDASFCHCRMCQKAFGSFGAPLVAAPTASFAWTRGAPGTFRSSAIVERGFCRACGTPLYLLEDGGDYELAIGSLDEPARVRLSHVVGVESKLPWADGLPSLPGRRTDEDRAPADLARLKSRQHPDHDTASWPR
ncbi:MAG: GFA family protein [Myxococcota bacterium]